MNTGSEPRTELQSAREEIDRLDAQLAALFEARMEAVRRIAACKEALGLPVRDEGREEAVLAQNLSRLHDPALRPWFAEVLRSLMAAARAWQEENRT